jgi:hypothetical protein
VTIAVVAVVGCAPRATTDDDSAAAAGSPSSRHPTLASSTPQGESIPSASASSGFGVAASIAVADERFAVFLKNHAFRVDSAEPAALPHGRDGRLVTVKLDPAVAPAEWPLADACMIAREDPAITGIVWLIDVEAGEVAAVSPQWDGLVHCIDAAVRQPNHPAKLSDERPAT